MRPHSPKNPASSTYFEPTNVWHKHGRPRRRKTHRSKSDEGVDLDGGRQQLRHASFMLLFFSDFLCSLSCVIGNIITKILLLPIWVLSFMLNARTRFPLLMWILLFPVLMLQTVSVSGAPDSPNSNRNMSNLPIRPAAAAAATAAVGIAAANQSDANNQSAARSESKRDYNELKKRKKGLTRKRKKSSYDYGLARSSLELDPTANSQQVRKPHLLFHRQSFPATHSCCC